MLLLNTQMLIMLFEELNMHYSFYLHNIKVAFDEVSYKCYESTYNDKS